jgi:hypothetical protein
MLGMTERGEAISPAPLLLRRVFASLVAIAALVAMWRARNDLAQLGRRAPSTQTLLVLLVPVTAVCFIASTNPQNWSSNRYLLPWLTALPLQAGSLLAALWQRRRLARIAVIVLLAAPVTASIMAAREAAQRDQEGRVVHRHEALLDVVRELERQGVRGGYAPYWVAYKAAFLSREKVVFSPMGEWDRYPPYTHAVDALPREAYVFAVDPPNVDQDDRAVADAARERFEAKLAAAGVPYGRQTFGFYRLYTAAPAGRLMPPPIRRLPPALARPRADLKLATTPGALSPATRERLAIDIVNLSDDFWSADGIPARAGSHRVAVAYRWLARDGTPVVVEGERTPLPWDVPAQGALRVHALVITPPATGSFILRLTLVQEDVAWFDQATGSALDVPIEIRAEATAARAERGGSGIFSPVPRGRLRLGSSSGHACASMNTPSVAARRPTPSTASCAKKSGTRSRPKSPAADRWTARRRPAPSPTT